MKHVERAGWVGVLAIVITADVLADRTMSDAFKTASRHPVLGPVVVSAWFTLTAHLLGLLPRHRDPVQILVDVIRHSFRERFCSIRIMHPDQAHCERMDLQ